MKRLNKQTGFTLIELLLYVGLSAVMLLTVSVFLASLLQARLKNQAISEVNEQGYKAMSDITGTIRNAEAINSPLIGVSASTLSVDVIDASKDPTIFNLVNGVIRLTEGAGSAIPLTNSRVIASAISFENLSHAGTPGTIRIQFTLTHTNSEGKNEYSFSKIFIGSASLRQP